MSDEPIATLMQHAVKVVSLDDSVLEVEAFLTREGLSWAPVRGDQAEIIGVISDADLRRFHAQQGDPETPVWRQCTYRPISVSVTTPIREVARLMIAQRIHHVVVTQGEEVVGVVSSLDLVGRLV